MRAIIDRIEDGVAVLLFEDGGRAYVGADQLPAGAGEGTVLQVRWEVEERGGEDVTDMIDRLRRRTEDHLP